MSKQNNFSMKQYLRLQKYLMELHSTGRACVFSDFSGHVDHLNIRITPDRETYTYALFEMEVNFPSPKYNFYLPDNWEKYVDEIIEDIEVALSEREERMAAQEERRKEARRARLAELKAEFESES